MAAGDGELQVFDKALVVVRHLFYRTKITTDFTQTYQTIFQSIMD